MDNEAIQTLKSKIKELEKVKSLRYPLDKISTDVINRALNEKLLPEAQKTDLTDGGATTLHKHDHGNLDGLSDDDHTIYIKADGTRAFSGEQSMGTNKITNVVDPTANQDVATKKYVDGLASGATLIGVCEVTGDNDYFGINSSFSTTNGQYLFYVPREIGRAHV